MMISLRLALVAVVIGSFASCRGGCRRRPPDATSSPLETSATDRRLALFPAEARMVVIVDVAKLRQAAIFGKVLGGKSTFARARAAFEREISEYAKATGFHPLRDIDTIVVATAPKDQAGLGVIVRGRHLDEKRLVGYMRALKRADAELIATKRGTRTVWSPRKQPDAAAIFLDDRTLLVGSGGWAERMADLADGLGSARSAASNADLVRLLGGVSGHAMVGVSLEPDLIERLAQTSYAGAREAPTLRHTTWTVDAGQKIVVQVIAELTDPGAAKALVEEWEKKLADRKLGAGVRLRSDGATFRIDADLDEERLQGLVTLAGMFATFPLLHMD